MLWVTNDRKPRSKLLILEMPRVCRLQTWAPAPFLCSSLSPTVLLVSALSLGGSPRAKCGGGSRPHEYVSPGKKEEGVLA